MPRPTKRAKRGARTIIRRSPLVLVPHAAVHDMSAKRLESLKRAKEVLSGKFTDIQGGEEPDVSSALGCVIEYLEQKERDDDTLRRYDNTCREIDMVQLTDRSSAAVAELMMRRDEIADKTAAN